MSCIDPKVRFYIACMVCGCHLYNYSLFPQFCCTAIQVFFVIPVGGYSVVENTFSIEMCVAATGSAGPTDRFHVNVATSSNTAMSELRQLN